MNQEPTQDQQEILDGAIHATIQLDEQLCEHKIEVAKFEERERIGKLLRDYQKTGYVWATELENITRQCEQKPFEERERIIHILETSEALFERRIVAIAQHAKDNQKIEELVKEIKGRLQGIYKSAGDLGELEQMIKDYIDDELPSLKDK